MKTCNLSQIPRSSGALNEKRLVAVMTLTFLLLTNAIPQLYFIQKIY